MKIITSALIALSLLAGVAQAEPSLASGQTTQGQMPSPN
jgi:hypothetical protein